MNSEPITTKEAYKAALKNVDALWNARPGTADGDKLDALVTQIEAYEKLHFPISTTSQSHS